MIEVPKTIKQTALFSLVAFSTLGLTAVPASAHYYTTRCDRDGDSCYQVYCDDDGDNCQRVRHPRYSNSYGNGYGKGNGYDYGYGYTNPSYNFGFSVGRPSTNFGPVQPFGERRIIIGNCWRCVKPFSRASF